MTAIDEPATEARELYEYIGNKIRFYRERLHWTPDELGVLVGRTGSIVARWENTTSVITIPDVYVVADVLDVSVFDLLPRSVT